MRDIIFFMSINHHDDLQMPPNWAISLLIHHYHFRSQISTIGPYHCIRNDQISWKQVWNCPNRISDGYDLIKTILAWCTTQIQSQIRLHVDSATQNLIPRLGSAHLSSAGLGSRLMTWHVGPLCWHVDDVSTDWTMTCLLTGRCRACWLCMHMSWWHHLYPGLARGSGRLVFVSGQLIWVKKMYVTVRAAVSDIRFRHDFQ
jgi:hypothetical protein